MLTTNTPRTWTRPEHGHAQNMHLPRTCTHPEHAMPRRIKTIMSTVTQMATTTPHTFLGKTEHPTTAVSIRLGIRHQF